MSHNLYFEKVGTDECVDFPIQLPTDISRKIIGMTNRFDMLCEIEEYLFDCKWDSIAVNQMLDRIEFMMCDKNLSLEIN